MKIAIVGAGTGGTKLIELFHQMDQTEIKTVVDKNHESQGVVLAKQLGIKCVTDMTQISSEVDVIIEATGNASVLSALQKKFLNSIISLQNKKKPQIT